MRGVRGMAPRSVLTAFCSQRGILLAIGVICLSTLLFISVRVSSLLISPRSRTLTTLLPSQLCSHRGRMNGITPLSLSQWEVNLRSLSRWGIFCVDVDILARESGLFVAHPSDAGTGSLPPLRDVLRLIVREWGSHSDAVDGAWIASFEPKGVLATDAAALQRVLSDIADVVPPHLRYHVCITLPMETVKRVGNGTGMAPADGVAIAVGARDVADCADVAAPTHDGHHHLQHVHALMLSFKCWTAHARAQAVTRAWRQRICGAGAGPCDVSVVREGAGEEQDALASRRALIWPRVMVWTVDTRSDALAALALNADRVISNEPQLLMVQTG